MFHNTQTKHACSIQVWWTTRPMCRPGPEHLKRRDENYTHIRIYPLEGGYEGLVYNKTFKFSKYQNNNSASWYNSKLTDHVKRFHPSLKLVKLYMKMHSRNTGKRMSSMLTTGDGRPTNSLQFGNYMANTIDKCKINMDAWYVYRNQRI